MAQSDFGELAFIDWLRKRFETQAGNSRVVKAIGDDASVTVQSGGARLIATTDSLVEGVHFSLDYHDPYRLGRKALAISLSDVAAMGAAPLFFLSSVTVPGRVGAAFLDELYRGLGDMATERSTTLIGGNTASSMHEITLTTTVLGEALPDEVVYRSSARPGDALFVTGMLGDSALGLKILSGGLSRAGFEAQVERHLNPAPRLLAGRELAKRKLATSMIDVSDGLVLDLKRVAAESRAGAVVELDRVPLSAPFKRALEKEPKLMELALAGGEDYELLFTASPEKAGEIKTLEKELGLAFTEIGRITDAGAGVKVIDRDGREVRLARDGYEHSVGG
jgi:thiamine-monophosphate kinase